MGAKVKILASMLTLIAVVSTIFTVGELIHVQHKVVGATFLLLLTPTWLPTACLDVACVALWRMICMASRFRQTGG
jgi:hypothetical protein